MKVYTVKKNSHKSRWIPKFWFNKKEFTFEFIVKEGWFNSSLVEGDGISKIVGISSIIHGERILGKIPFTKQFVNSIVIGWYPTITKDKYDLYIISDYKGVEKRIPYMSFSAGQKVKVRIKLNTVKVYLTINNIYTVPIEFKNWNFGYYLFPYFGGKAKAYNDYVVYLNL